MIKYLFPLYFLCCAPLGGLAQAPSTPAASPALSAPGGTVPPLTEDERDRLKAAREKVMNTPEVQAALVKERDAANELRAAMIADDKSLGPILDKLPAPSNSAPAGSPVALTDEDRQKLRAESAKLKDSPEGQAMGEAVRNFRSALRAAIEKEDPTLAPVLDRIDAAFRQSSPLPAPKP